MLRSKASAALAEFPSFLSIYSKGRVGAVGRVQAPASNFSPRPITLSSPMWLVISLAGYKTMAHDAVVARMCGNNKDDTVSLADSFNTPVHW